MAWLNRHFRALDGRYHGPEGDAFAVEELRPVARRFLPPGGRALEIGCGYGRNLVALAGLPAAAVVGADPDGGQLAGARTRLLGCPEGQRRRVALVRQEPFRLPLRDGSFDLVVLWQVLEHVIGPAAKRRVLAESLRVLRPGGHLLVETPNRWFPVDYHDNHLPFVHWTRARRLREWLTWRVRGERYAPSDYVSLPGLERLLRRAAPQRRCVRATRFYFADGFAGAWRDLGGTQVALKRAIFAGLAPAHALLSLFGGSADLLSPSLRVVWRVDRRP
jgi:SAM-dependent methyltransferase